MTGAGAPPSRRRFLGGALVLLCAAPVFGAGCGDAALPVEPTRPRRIGPWEIPAGTVLSPARYAVLAALMDALIPGDDGSPGATLAHAAYYLDQLLGAFGSDPPRIFAGGPTSGRHGGLDEFSHFQPLTRVEEIRWRTYLEGSRGIAEREFNGPVTGLAERYEQGLDAVDALAESSSGAGFAMMPLGSRRAALSHVDAAFLELVYEHASHRALLDCNGCHGLGTTFPHAQSPKLPVCGACHSESAHPGGADACVGCHDAHGSPNVFLIRPTLTLPDGGAAAIHFTKAEGASADGLARAGIAGQKAGTGLCEVCHSSTAHYDSDGGGTPHQVAWCGQCHDHQASFAPSPPP